MSCSLEKRRGWTDLSDHVYFNDYRRRLRNGRRMWSCEQFAGHRPALDRIGRVQLNLPGKVDPRVVAVKSGSAQQPHRDISPSPFSLRTNCPFSLLYTSTGVIGVHSTYHIATMSPVGSAKNAQKESTMARVLGAGMYNHINAIISIAQ